MNRWLLGLAALVVAAVPAYADRDGSGTYVVPNTFTASTTITAAGHNQNWSDISTEMTNSLPRDGQAGMLAPLPLPNGTDDLPSLTFTSDTNSGMYRVGADNIGLAAGGVSAIDWTATAVTVSLATTFSQNVTVASGKTISIGSANVPTDAEGSWTPALAIGGTEISTQSGTYGTQVGRYIRIGDLVTVWGTIVVSNNGSGTGNLTITGLPFAASTVSGLNYSGSIGHLENTDENTGVPWAVNIASAGSVINILAGGTTSDDFSEVSNTDILDTFEISVTVTYRTGS